MDKNNCIPNEEQQKAFPIIYKVIQESLNIVFDDVFWLQLIHYKDTIFYRFCQ